MKGYYVVFITAPKEKAFELAQVIIKEKVAACSNIVEDIASIYWWKGKIEND
ncbi:MAG: divalent cation tolerance protein CutA, partial [Synergistetes bacterium]|nr:divalent cation tolerance protein CutA [Synergistota bacterium]